MGEGWSDWYAKDFLVAQFPALDNPAVNGDVHMGTYTDATPNTIRREGLDCPVNAVVGCAGFTYGDFGIGGPRCTTTARSGPRRCGTCAQAIGSANAERLITQGMRLSPPEPSFLDERNAILAADAAAGGTFQTQIWTVFAARGMGYYASTTGSDDTSPVEDFSPPPGARRIRAGRSPGGSRTRPARRWPVRRWRSARSWPQADADGRYSLAGRARRARTRT